jgi:glycosyltransferase involved in cell wall biosynthesis
MKNKVKLLYVINNVHPLKYFLKTHIKNLNNTGCYNISIILNCNEKIDFKDYEVNFYHFPIKRSPNIFYDTIVLLRLVIHLLVKRYDIVHSITPKSGLLLSIAGFFTFTKFRIHTYTGQVWANYKGLKRKIYINIDKLISELNTNLLADSVSQMKYLIHEGVVNKNKINVLNKGSICGVDLNRFKPNIRIKYNLRKKYKLLNTDFVILFIGRLNFDKGIIDLTDAIENLNLPHLHLIIVGPDENKITAFIEKRYNKEILKNIHFIRETDAPEDYMNMSDVICLPSYREGFGNVIIEAAAVGIPSIVTNIYGLKDTVIDGITGFTFELGNIVDLQNKINYIDNNRALLLQMSDNSLNFASENFDSNVLSKCLHNYYISLF